MLVEISGYRMAWIARVKKGEAKTLVPTGWAGVGGNGSHPPKSIQALAKRSQGFVDNALLNRQPEVLQNLHLDPGQKSWHSDASKQGYASFVVLPLLLEKDPLGALVIYAAEPDAFADPETGPLMAIAREISRKLEPE